MKRISAWSIAITWDNGDQEELSDIPNGLAQDIDSFLSEIEELNADAEYEVKDPCKSCGKENDCSASSKYCSDCSYDMKREEKNNA